MIKAKVRNGRLLLDEPTDLPEGTEVALEPIDSDDLDVEERRQLHEALAESEADVRAGRVYPIDDVLAELGQRRAPSR